MKANNKLLEPLSEINELLKLPLTLIFNICFFAWEQRQNRGRLVLNRKEQVEVYTF